MATAPETNDPAPRDRRIVPTAMPPVPADDSAAESDVYLEDFLGDADTGSDGRFPATGEHAHAQPVRLSPPAPPHVPPGITASSPESSVSIIDPATRDEEDGALESWQDPAPPHSDSSAGYDAAYAEPDYLAGDAPGVHAKPASVSSPLAAATATSAAPHRLPHGHRATVAAPTPPRRASPTPRMANPSNAGGIPGWLWFVIGILIGLIAGMLILAKTGLAAKAGLISSNDATAHRVFLLKEERAQVQAMLDEKHRDKQINLAREMAGFRDAHGHKAPEQSTLDDFRFPVNPSTPDPAVPVTVDKPTAPPTGEGGQPGNG